MGTTVQQRFDHSYRCSMFLGSHTTSPDYPDLGCVEVGELQTKGTYDHQDMPTNHCTFHFVTKGRFRFRADGRQWELGPGSCWISQAGKRYAQADCSQPGQLYWAKYRGQLLPRLFADLGLAADERQFAYPQTSAILDCLTEALNNRIARPSPHYYARLLGWRLAALMCGRRRVKDDAFSAVVQQILDRNGYVPSIPEFASQCGVSRASLHRHCQRTLACSPKQFILSQQLELARRLLGGHGMSIKDLSAYCGFDDPNYFCRIFSKQYGLAPSNWALGERPEIPITKLHKA